MYCPRCRNQNDEGSKYCSKCGCLLNDKNDVVKSDNKYNVLLLLSFIFAFILPIVGLIIGIISVIITYRYMKKYDEKVRNLRFGIAGIILSIFFIIIYTAMFTIIFNHPINRYDNAIFGRYECSNLTPSKIVFLNNEVTVIDDDNEIVIGSYSVNKRNIMRRGSCVSYKLNFNPYITYIENDYSNFNFKYITIRRCNNDTTISFDDYKIYSCIR